MDIPPHQDMDEVIETLKRKHEERLVLSNSITRIMKFLFTEKNQVGFIMNLNDLVKIGGYTSKANAKRALVKHLVEGKDYKIDGGTYKDTPNLGERPTKDIWLTIRSFKTLLAFSDQPSGRIFRDYLLQVKRRYVDISQQTNQEMQISEQLRTDCTQNLIESLQRDESVSDHDLERDYVAKNENGQIEVVTAVGICDVITATDAIEVKHIDQWKHGLGQAYAYGYATGKTPRLHLFGGIPGLGIIQVCQSLKMKLSYSQAPTSNTVHILK